MDIEVSGDDIELRLPGVLLLRASYLAEGYYEENAAGQPPEQDLFHVEVFPRRPGSVREPITFPLLLPASLQAEDPEEPEEELAALRRYLLALAAELQDAPVEAWESICERSRGWIDEGDGLLAL